MNIVSLIPARGGSKGVQKKNIKLMAGNPLINYTIEASISSKKISRTIVSSDDNEIINIAKKAKAEVPFVRPKELSGDKVSDFPVIKHCLNYLISEEEYIPDLLVFLRPTTPIPVFNEIDKVVEKLINNKSADSVRTTRPAIYPPYWMKKINSLGLLEPYDKHVEPYFSLRRQDLPKVVMCDGYVDVARVGSILKMDSFPPGKILSYYREDVPFVDIDNQEDWDYCENYILSKN